jgi:malic enzyme
MVMQKSVIFIGTGAAAIGTLKILDAVRFNQSIFAICTGVV